MALLAMAAAAFEALLEDWTNEGFDPFAAPQETGSAFGPKHGSNTEAITRKRLTAKRMALHHRDLDRLSARLPPEHVDKRPAAAIRADIHPRQIVEALGRAAVDRKMLRAVEFDYIAERLERRACQGFERERPHGRLLDRAEQTLRELRRPLAPQ